MAIIVSKNGSDAERIDESRFGLEDKLQEYVKNNPDIIPIYEISEDARLLVLAREFSTNSGPIDALGVDQDGNIYVIETKLYKNPDKRIVLAQALDYGASLWRHSGDSTEFIEVLNKKVIDQFGMNLEEKLQDFFDIDDSNYLVEAMGKNVLNGKIKFVILMDTVEDRLKDLIAYVNQNSRFDIYAVDLEYYKHDEFEIIIPRLYGSEVKKTVSNDTEDNRFDNQLIIDRLESMSNPYLKIDKEKTSSTFTRLTSDYLDQLITPRDDSSGGWKNGQGYYYEIRTDRSGYIRIGLVFTSEGVSEEQTKEQDQIIQLSSRKPKPNWKWFNAESWKIDGKQSIDEIEKEIQTVLSEKIPKFEERLKKSL